MAKAVIVNVNETVPGHGPTVLAGTDVVTGDLVSYVRADLDATVYSTQGTVAAGPTPNIGSGGRSNQLCQTAAMAANHHTITVSKN